MMIPKMKYGKLMMFFVLMACSTWAFAGENNENECSIDSINIQSSESVLAMYTNNPNFSDFLEIGINHQTAKVKFNNGVGYYPVAKPEGFFLFYGGDFWGLYYFNIADEELTHISLWSILIGIVVIIVIIQIIKKLLYIIAFLLLLYLFLHFKFDLSDTWSSLMEAFTSFKAMLGMS